MDATANLKRNREQAQLPTPHRREMDEYLEDNDDIDTLFAEQRREIIEARMFLSDIDYAFKLQMEEAISASLAMHESCSSAKCEVDSLSRDVIFDWTELLDEDIDRLEQVQGDREESKKLVREAKKELDLRIHDRKFAREIMNITDEDWNLSGDYYQRPYGSGEGCSSWSCDKVLVDRENVKVYCKGLASVERIRDSDILVAGLGVGIFDSMDNLIFKVSKSLEIIGERNPTDLVSLEAEVEALIEGSNVALMMDLKNVTFLFDDLPLYEYINGKRQPDSGEILNLVTQVTCLQQKLQYCNHAVVPQKDNRFAYGLARNSIISQISWPEQDGDGRKISRETCVICYENTNTNQMFTVDGCLHRYCFSCMKRHVEAKLLNGMESACPHEGCSSMVPIESCGNFMDSKLVAIMIQRKKEASIATSDKVYCPYLRCSTLMSKVEVLKFTKLSFAGAESSSARKCVKCHRYFCVDCKVPWHNDATCSEYKNSNFNGQTEDAMLNKLARRKLWRQCAKCNHMVELAQGCHHITCRCGHEFCYTCGTPWNNKKAACKCPFWVERNIIYHEPPQI